MFPACEKRHCITITINDDCLVEVPETFNITVEKYGGIGDRLTINPSEGQIIIQDTDGMSVMQRHLFNPWLPSEGCCTWSVCVSYCSKAYMH